MTEVVDDLREKFAQFYLAMQRPETHFLVRCRRDGEIRVGVTGRTLRDHGFTPKEVSKGYKRGYLQDERIARNNTIVMAVVFWEKIDVVPDSLLDRIGLYLKKWLRKLKIN